MRIWLAIKVFFAVLFSGMAARRVRLALLPPEAATAAEEPKAAKAEPRAATPVLQPPARNDAISLLAALQREARFVDLALESLDEYSDEQVGAAARDVLRDCRSLLNRLFDLQPVVHDSEGASVEVPRGSDAGRFRLTGNVVGEPPYRGRLVHHGWQAARCEIPQWSGSAAAAQVVAPAEVELA